MLQDKSGFIHPFIILNNNEQLATAYERASALMRQSFERNAVVRYNGVAFPALQAWRLLEGDRGTVFVDGALSIRGKEKSQRYEVLKATNQIFIRDAGLVLAEAELAVQTANSTTQRARATARRDSLAKSLSGLDPLTPLEFMYCSNGEVNITCPPVLATHKHSVSSEIRERIVTTVRSNGFNVAAKGFDITGNLIDAILDEQAFIAVSAAINLVQTPVDKAVALANVMHIPSLLFFADVVRDLLDAEATLGEYLADRSALLANLVGRAEAENVHLRIVDAWDASTDLVGVLMRLSGHVLDLSDAERSYWNEHVRNAFAGYANGLGVGSALVNSSIRLTLSGRTVQVNLAEHAEVYPIPDTQARFTSQFADVRAALRQAVANAYWFMFGGDAPQLLRWSGLGSWTRVLMLRG